MMIDRDQLHYRLLKFLSNKIEKNNLLDVSGVLKELGLEDYIKYSDDIAEELENRGFIKIVHGSKRRIFVKRLKLEGKYFIENYLKDNSNLIQLNSVIEETEELTNINLQLKNAKKYLLSTDETDYSNAVKEAIGAAETVVKIALNDSKITLGQGLRKIAQEKKMHKAFEKGISSLYGFNSDSGAVRHGFKPEQSERIDYTEAKFLVNIYSSFVNYIVERYDIM